MTNSLFVEVERFEGTNAVLSFDNGQEITLPIHSLPQNIQEGDKLPISIGHNGLSPTEILNTILSGAT